MRQLADTILSGFCAPSSVMQAPIDANALSFSCAVVLTWIYEWTPKGIKAASATGQKKALKSPELPPYEWPLCVKPNIQDLHLEIRFPNACFATEGGHLASTGEDVCL